MKIGTFGIATPVGRVRRVGVKTADGVVDATAARISLHEGRLPADAAARVGSAEVPADILQIIAAGDIGLGWVREAVEAVRGKGNGATSLGARTLYREDEITLLAPIPRPPAIASFITWKAHIDESNERGYTMLNFPSLDSDMRAYYKGNADSVAASGTPLHLPPYATELDVECELAAVVGPAVKDVDVEGARRAIVGYCIYNDVSIRAIQLKEMKFGLGPTKGKDADNHNILGPWLVTADEVGDVHNLEMSFHVNGEKKSSYNTREMAWDHADLLSYLSRGQTIYPGHVLTSGCYPGGSALEVDLKLKSGDCVSMKIDKLGSLDNTLV